MDVFATLNALQTLAQKHASEPFKLLVIEAVAEHVTDVTEECIDWLSKLLA